MNSLKATTRAERTVSGKPTGRYIAELMGFQAIGTSKDEALMMLESRLNLLCRFETTKRYLVTHTGTVFSLWHHFHGWGYDIIHTDTYGAQSPGSCMMGDSFTDAYAAMKSHWEQMCADEALQPTAA